MRKAYRKALHYGFVGARLVVNKSPRLKNSIKRVLQAQVGYLSTGLKGYPLWVATNFPDFIEIAKLREVNATFEYKPLISIIVPTYNTDLTFLKDCLDSVRGQIYENWELCIVDDGSSDERVRLLIQEYAKSDKRIKFKFLKKNKHIAGASNEAIALASGEFVALFDHDDLIWPNALFEVVKALNEDRGLDFLYTDEDKITESRFEHGMPFFKPDWNPDFLRSVNYITHFTVIRKSVVDAVGGFRDEYNGAQDWDLFLRITGMTNKVHHVPKVVYSWRVHNMSTAKHTEAKPYVVEAQRKALLDDATRRGYPNVTVEQDKKHPGYWNMTYPLEGSPLISVIIPNKNQYKIVKHCINSIYTKTTYRNFEIILVDTGSTDTRVIRWYKRIANQHGNFRLVNWPEQPFSHSRSCNEGAKVARGDLLVMLNNDTEVLTPNWLELLAGDAQRKEIGAVGCLLFFPDGYHIQHAGVGVGLGGVAANSFSMLTLQQKLSQTQHLMLNTKHDMTVVTGACLMLRKELFTDVRGFAETFPNAYNDVDLCLRLYEKGYQNLYTPYVRLLHHESISLGTPAETGKRNAKEFVAAKNLFTTKWAEFVAHDPNLNPNLCKDNAFYDTQPV